MNKKGQVWIETVIYTLIAFVMISLVLTYAKPKIEELQDKALIEQNIEILEDVNNLILGIKDVAGNKRKIELTIKKGTLKIDGENDSLIFEMESSYTYSQPGEDISQGNLIINTKEQGKYNLVTLTKDYSKYNITSENLDQLKQITKAPRPYTLMISNYGGSPTNIDITLE